MKVLLFGQARLLEGKSKALSDLNLAKIVG